MEEGGKGGGEAEQVVAAVQGVVVLAEAHLAFELQELRIEGGRGKGETNVQLGICLQEEAFPRDCIAAAVPTVWRWPGLLNEVTCSIQGLDGCFHLGFLGVALRVVRVLLEPRTVGGYAFVEFALGGREGGIRMSGRTHCIKFCNCLSLLLLSLLPNVANALLFRK